MCANAIALLFAAISGAPSTIVIVDRVCYEIRRWELIVFKAAKSSLRKQKIGTATQHSLTVCGPRIDRKSYTY